MRWKAELPEIAGRIWKDSGGGDRCVWSVCSTCLYVFGMWELMSAVLRTCVWTSCKDVPWCDAIYTARTYMDAVREDVERPDLLPLLRTCAVDVRTDAPST